MAILKDSTQGYESTYSNTINDLVNKAVNREAFNYDPASDAAYQAYAKQYTTLGKQAMEDTLANVATNTGGLASSYATSASQQSYNNYMQQLANKIPELEENAYNRYQDEYNNNLNLMGQLSSLDQAAYNQYATDRDYDRSVYESDRDYDYQVGRDAVADDQWQKEYDRAVYESDRDYDYQVSRDEVADNQWEQEYMLNLRQVEDDEAYNTWYMQYQDDQAKYTKMLESWQTLGYATKEVANYFGVKSGTKTSDQSYKDAEIALENAQLAETIRHNKASEALSAASKVASTKKASDSGDSDPLDNYTPTSFTKYKLSAINNAIKSSGTDINNMSDSDKAAYLEEYVTDNEKNGNKTLQDGLTETDVRYIYKQFGLTV